MTDHFGRFGWYDLMTPNPTAAVDFYGSVVGYGTQVWSGAGKPYTMWLSGQQPVGGVMELPEEARAMGAPPHWIGYVIVRDVEASTAQVEGLGGRVYRAPADIPTVGRFSIVADPSGAVVALFQATGSPMAPRSGEHVGEVAWHELTSTDPEAAWGFYSALLGWEKTESMDMGPEMGVYQMYGRDGKTLGGYMKAPPSWQGPSAWLYYTNVARISTAVETLKAKGGKMIHGPHQVPTGDWVGVAMDPQGAVFALFSKVE